ncbi:hypothetical protein ABTL55_19605, partial [Acinetobacter baumannii]
MRTFLFMEVQYDTHIFSCELGRVSQYVRHALCRASMTCRGRIPDPPPAAALDDQWRPIAIRAGGAASLAAPSRN